jgi:type II secretory pathway pseudopilin PulG
MEFGLKPPYHNGMANTTDAHIQRCRGWTIIELVVVLCVILVLLGMTIAVWGIFSHNVKVSATKSLVNALSTAIDTYSTKLWSWQEGTPGAPSAEQKSSAIFDLNHDGLIDGAPAIIAGPKTDGGFTPAQIASGYTGFIHMTNAIVKPSFIAPNFQLLDAWKHPIRIAYAAKIYGTQGFGIWSVGPDGIDGNEDDLRSWE